MVKKQVSKPKWKSKTVWSAIAVLAVTLVNAYGIELPLEVIYPILGACGLYGVRDAVAKIK